MRRGTNHGRLSYRPSCDPALKEPFISFSDRLRLSSWALSPSPTVCVAAHFLPHVRAHVAMRPSQDRRISKFAPRRYVRTCVRRNYVRRSLRAYVRPRCAARYMRASEVCCSMLVVGARSAHSPSLSVPCFRAHARVYVRTYVRSIVRTYVRRKKTVHEVRHAVARASVRTYVRTCASSGALPLLTRCRVVVSYRDDCNGGM